jgi:hypothetical protein
LFKSEGDEMDHQFPYPILVGILRSSLARADTVDRPAGPGRRFALQSTADHGSGSAVEQAGPMSVNPLPGGSARQPAGAHDMSLERHAQWAGDFMLAGDFESAAEALLDLNAIAAELGITAEHPLPTC